MWFWPFSRKPLEPLGPTELRDRLIQAAMSGSARELKRLCKGYAKDVAANLDTISVVPEHVRNNSASANDYVQALIRVAQCLAVDARAPELWNTLTKQSDDSPFVRWERWLKALPERMEALEYETLIEEVHEHLARTESLSGTGAQWLTATGQGRLGELLFKSGHVAESVSAFQRALDICVEAGDREGHLIYLENLLESHRYLDNGLQIPTAEKILEQLRELGVPVTDPRYLRAMRQLVLLKQGVPLLRMVVFHNGVTCELDEIAKIGNGSYQLNFERNRPHLRKSMTLVQRGKELTSAGSYADALEKFCEAAEVDPHDPDPHYLTANCYLEMGMPAAAIPELEIVEELAPNWFHSRTDLWLARGLVAGTIEDGAFRVSRLLEDSKLKPKEARDVARQAVDRYPDYAPLLLEYGKILLNLNDTRGAEKVLRRARELAEEPGLESRICMMLAAALPRNPAEQKQLYQQVLTLDGDCFSQASARLCLLR